MPILALPTPVFKPAMRIITNITNANPASITTSFAHGYITGLIVRLDVPLGFGMQQVNQKFGTITVTGNTTFTITIDTTQFDPFSTPAAWPYSYQSAQSVPIGEDNSILTGAVVNVLPY